MGDYNLLVTYHPNQAGLAEKEIRRSVGDLGGTIEELDSACIEGVFCIRVSGDARGLVTQLRSTLLDTPETLVHTYHWTPIELWVEADEGVMTEAVRELARGIGDDERWMMHMHKRHHQKHSEELVLTLTDSIKKGKVDLKRPDKIIVVEVLGGMAGMSLLTREEIIDVNRLRQEVGVPRIV